MQVQARLGCNEIVDRGSNGREVKLSPVYSNDPNSPNYSFSKATPSGQVSLQITNPAAYAAFEVGKTYDVVFTEYVKPAV